MTINIGGLLVGEGEPCAVVVEIGNAHNGDFDRALRLLDAAQACGASAAKLQCYSVEELVALRGDGPAPAQWSGRSMRDLYTQAMTPREWFPALYRHARDIGLPLFSSVFGLESLALLESVGNPCYKISKFERNVEWLLGAVVPTGKPVIVSSPVPQFRPCRSAGVLYCPGSYPCAMEDVQLPADFDAAGFTGLSSHCLASTLPIAAVARGAKMLEYHFHLADEPSALEANVSLTEHQVGQLVRDVRECEALLA